MIEERSLRLLATLESRAETALGELDACRAQLRELTARLRDLEAAKLELAEENRELSEQNRELEEDNGRLRERLRRGEPAPAFPGAARRAQGLSALIGHRPRDAVPREEDAETQPSQQAASQQKASPQDAAGRQESRQPAPSPTEPISAEPSAAESPSADSDADARQGSLAIGEAPSPEGLLAQWYQRYPQTFFKGHTRPLKVGIHLDLAAREPWPEKLVRRALAGYVNLPRYLKGVREGAERIGLDGQPHGQVDAEAARHAHRKLESLQSERARRGSKAKQPGHAARKRRDGGTGSTESPRKPKPKAPSDRPAPTASLDDTALHSPDARMEAKLSALLAKHNQRR